jgi:hypothetical protein
MCRPGPEPLVVLGILVEGGHVELRHATHRDRGSIRLEAPTDEIGEPGVQRLSAQRRRKDEHPDRFPCNGLTRGIRHGTVLGGVAVHER